MTQVSLARGANGTHRELVLTRTGWEAITHILVSCLPRNYVCGLKPTQPQPAEQPQPGFRRAAGAETQEENQHRDECPLRLREEFSSGELRPLAAGKGIR